MVPKKYKVGELLDVTFHDIHSNDNGWMSLVDALTDSPCEVNSIGYYAGVTKNKELCLAGIRNQFSGKYEPMYGVRLYIPLGCIISIKKLK